MAPEQYYNGLPVSIQLISPASGDLDNTLWCGNAAYLVSIQLISPASGDN